MHDGIGNGKNLGDGSMHMTGWAYKLGMFKLLCQTHVANSAGRRVDITNLLSELGNIVRVSRGPRLFLGAFILLVGVVMTTIIWRAPFGGAGWALLIGVGIPAFGIILGWVAARSANRQIEDCVVVLVNCPTAVIEDQVAGRIAAKRLAPVLSQETRDKLARLIS